MARPHCFGTWEFKDAGCMGGFDPAYPGSVRPPCMFRESCSVQTEKGKGNVVPIARVTQQRPTSFGAVAAAAVPPAQHATSAAAAAAPAFGTQHHAAVPVQHAPMSNDPAHMMQNMMGMMMQNMMMGMMQPQPLDPANPNAPRVPANFDMTSMMRMMLMFQMMQGMMPPPAPVVTAPPPGAFPGQYQAPVNLSPVQFAATSFAVPSYLSTREPRTGRGFWRPLGNELGRGVLKAVGQVLAHAADHYPIDE